MNKTAGKRCIRRCLMFSGSDTAKIPDDEVPGRSAPDLPERFWGRPVITGGNCPPGCAACVEACPYGAIAQKTACAWTWDGVSSARNVPRLALCRTLLLPPITGWRYADATIC